MKLGRYSFRNARSLIQEVHTLLDHDLPALDGLENVPTEHWLKLKLALHEWIANLAQHADFRGQPLEVSVSLTYVDHTFWCVVEDNSTGFDLTSRLLTQTKRLQACPERGMGLLMLQALSGELSYSIAEEGICRLEFSISSSGDAWLNIPF
jgi:serine/threonine-protein kinase RsbW